MAPGSLETYGPERHAAGHAASPYRQSAGATSFLASALWEERLQTFEQELQPAVAANGQQRNDFTAGRNDDRGNRGGRGIHGLIALSSA